MYFYIHLKGDFCERRPRSPHPILKFDKYLEVINK